MLFGAPLFGEGFGERLKNQGNKQNYSTYDKNFLLVKGSFLFLKNEA